LRAAIAVVIVLLAAAGAQAQPAPLSLLDVPYVSQSEALCGGAAAAMVLRFWGERGVSAETFAPLVDRSAAGIRTTALIAALIQRGWQATGADGTDAILGGELSNGRPVISLIEDRPGVFHYVVVVGVTDRAVIFHDPARAPLRVLTREEFDRRWRAADRWMAIVLPPPRADAPRAAATPLPVGAVSCEQRIAQGISEAQAGDVESAERTLTGALACPGPAAARELAGVRFLQKRWDDAAQLAGEAAAIDPSDTYAWRLLGTSRFLLNQPLAALDAWNHSGEPRLDLVRVDGLERTRQRPVERMIGLAPGDVITQNRFVRAERALAELPSARSTRLELRPAGEGIAELHATVVERSAVPRDLWSAVMIGARAATTRAVDVSLGSVSGAGESVAFQWRFWPRRPRIAVSLRAPAAWPGTWGADVFGESQEFDLSQAESRRRGGRLVASRWLGAETRVEAHAGAERWNTTGMLGSFGVTTGLLSRAERLSAQIVTDGWAGSRRFGSLSAVVNVSSAARVAFSGTTPLGPVLTVSGGASKVTDAAPFDLWPAGDTGQARTTLARAHPVLDDGRMQVSRLGRSLVFGSSEAQYWWKAPALSRLGAVVFVDALRTMQRSGGAGALNDVDIGAGVGLASLLLPGRFRLDYAHGLRDGADAVTVRYVTPLW
jgi:predicted double-glycine peptidase